MINIQHVHPVIVEFREEMHKRFPNFLRKVAHFKWDEGKYAEKFSIINKRFEEIEKQLDETVWKDKSSQKKLKQQLLDQLPSITKMYQELMSNVSEEEWQAFEQEYKVKR